MLQDKTYGDVKRRPRWYPRVHVRNGESAIDALVVGRFVASSFRPAKITTHGDFQCGSGETRGVRSAQRRSVRRGRDCFACTAGAASQITTTPLYPPEKDTDISWWVLVGSCGEL